MAELLDHDLQAQPAPSGHVHREPVEAALPSEARY
jgi:hypothetical protein